MLTKVNIKFLNIKNCILLCLIHLLHYWQTNSGSQGIFGLRDAAIMVLDVVVEEVLTEVQGTFDLRDVVSMLTAVGLDGEFGFVGEVRS